jgi:hypothetical protein
MFPLGIPIQFHFGGLGLGVPEQGCIVDLFTYVWDPSKAQAPVPAFANSPNQKMQVLRSTLWLFNIAMENGPVIDDFPIKTSIYKGFSMAMLNNQMVN